LFERRRTNYETTNFRLELADKKLEYMTELVDGILDRLITKRY
jgi:hypothetical protein